MAVNAFVSGAADHVVMHRALHNPPGSYHGNPMREARGAAQWTAPQGFFGPLAMIALPYNEYLQRYGARREAMAAVVVEARKNGSRHPVVVLARPAVDGRGVPRRSRHRPTRSAGSTATSRSTGSPPSCSRRPSGRADLPNRPVYVAGYASSRRRAAPPAVALAARRHPRRRRRDGAAAVAAQTGLTTATSTSRRCTTASRRSCGSGSRCSACARSARRTGSSTTGGIDSDRPGAVPALSGGGALGNGRMHGVPQMLECYLQLSGRAGDRRRTGVDTAVACPSSPHLGGAVAYRAG